jgi:hypothetical protein
VEVDIGQQVLAPDPEGTAMIRATVVAFGDPIDAVEETTVEGKPVMRDVAIIRYDEGTQEGFTGRCRYELLQPIEGRV